MPNARLALAAGLLVAALAGPARASAAPAPFGHACRAQDGVRFCPTPDLASRVPSFDGTPIDVDVTLPRTGNGPFPTILLLHGLGQTKTAFEGTGGDPLYNNVYFARRGYAVVTPTARGFGNSCGPAVPHTGACARGWTHLGDIRYEVRDVQTLVGRLVDEGIVRPGAIGSTGISYGGGTSTMLAYLRNRVELTDGRLRPWRSPRGRAISLTAAWPRWLWTNGASIFTRNGRGTWSTTPFGVTVKAWADLIFAVPAAIGYEAPAGADPSADIARWKRLIDDETISAESRRVLRNSYLHHGVAALKGRPAALLFQSGWTDGLFPAGQSVVAYRRLLHRHPKAPVALQLGDLGHMPAGNHPKDVARFDRQGSAFFDAWLRHRGRRLRPGHVTAMTMTCPSSAPSGGGPFVADRFGRLAHGSLRVSTRRSLQIDQKGASQALAQDLDPTAGGILCARHAPDPASHAVFGRRSPGVTLLGMPVVSARVRMRGAIGGVVVRLWDYDPATKTQNLITRGVYRLTRNQRGRVAFDLDGNGWRFARGHRIVVELLGRDAPAYGPSPSPFTATFTHVQVRLPVRERPSRRRGIGRPGPLGTL